MTRIRLAMRDDVPAILAISNHFARTSPANFAIEPETMQQWQDSYDATHGRYPWLAADDEDAGIVGFARASPWKGRCAYAYAAEISVYVAPDAQGRGVGRALYEALFAICREQGFRTLLAGITVPNEPSVKLHEAMGMKQVALLEHIGWKFDRWHDVGYWQATFSNADAPPKPIQPVADVAGNILERHSRR